MEGKILSGKDSFFDRWPLASDKQTPRPDFRLKDYNFMLIVY